MPEENTQDTAETEATLSERIETLELQFAHINFILEKFTDKIINIEEKLGVAYYPHPRSLLEYVGME